MAKTVVEINALFPARAGLNRSASRRPARTAAVPRTRGAEPVEEGLRFSNANLFPARAGLNRT